MKRKFTVRVTSTVEVEMDESLLPDDDWREHFYRHIKSFEDLAELLAYNRVANGVEHISKLDGFADRDDSLCDLDVIDVETDID